MSALTLILASLTLVILAAAAVTILRRTVRLRGARLVTCPENGAPAALRLDAGAPALAPVGHEPLRVAECSRWPEHAGCGQQCLRQIETAADGCLVRSRVAEWYRGKACALCGKAFGEVGWAEHRPAMIDAEGRTAAWHEMRAEDLPAAFAARRPICWNCHVAEVFRHAHPDLVVERR